MAQGNRKVKIAMLTIALLCFVAHHEHVYAKNFIVGDSGGWKFDVVIWPKGKTFHADDTLEFKYNPTLHDVVIVDKEVYDSCKSRPGFPVFRTGDDRIKLAKGWNYFICDFPGHCDANMKIAVNAL